MNDMKYSHPEDEDRYNKAREWIHDRRDEEPGYRRRAPAIQQDIARMTADEYCYELLGGSGWSRVEEVGTWWSYRDDSAGYIIPVKLKEGVKKALRDSPKTYNEEGREVSYSDSVTSQAQALTDEENTIYVVFRPWEVKEALQVEDIRVASYEPPTIAAEELTRPTSQHERDVAHAVYNGKGMRLMLAKEQHEKPTPAVYDRHGYESFDIPAEGLIRLFNQLYMRNPDYTKTEPRCGEGRLISRLQYATSILLAAFEHDAAFAGPPPPPSQNKKFEEMMDGGAIRELV